MYYITVCGLNSEFRFGILEYIRITDIICQTEIYCNTIYAYIAFKYYANYIFIITIEKTFVVFHIRLYFVYTCMFFIVFYHTIFYLLCFTFKFFTLISALPITINSTVIYIYTYQYPLSYKSFNLQIINSYLFVCIHHYMYDMYLPYRTKCS